MLVITYEEGNFQPADYNNGEPNQWTDWSAELIIGQQSNSNIAEQLEMLQEFSAIELSNSLKNDAQKKAFWINTYNALVQYNLTKDATLFKKKSTFYRMPLLSLKDKQLSLDDIEHGILRKSQIKYGMGYFTHPFASDVEQILRIEQRDPRIHFALNCGARNCPPIRVYHPDQLEDELEENSAAFLEKVSLFDPDKNSLNTTPLFRWFKGDFGGEVGMLKLFKHFKVLKEDQNPNIAYNEYDWTLTLHHYVED